MSIKALQDYTFTSKYANYRPDLKRRETWVESQDRVLDMQLRKYPEISEDLKWAYEQSKKKVVLGSQRALQFGGIDIEKNNAKMYNCFDKTQQFVTSEGVKAFSECFDGQILKVLSHDGSWQNATVKNYGKAKVDTLHFKKSSNYFSVKATENHRWLLKDGSITDGLKVGDQLLKQVPTFQEFDYEKATPEERLYWCYGFTYGDGIINGDYSMVRLGGKDSDFEDRFTRCGFKSSSSDSLGGDVICYTGRYQKTSPDPKKDSPELIRAFVSGYLQADGTKNTNKNGSFCDYIQSSEADHIAFIRKCFPVAGVFIVSETDLTGQETNFGTRPFTIRFRIQDQTNTKTSAYTKLIGVENGKVEETWCLEVENTKSFVLPNGTPTGNCIASFCDRSRFFQECLWLLLCGCGTGFSVQDHHIDRLPSFSKKWNDNDGRHTKVFTAEDSIEGWADTLGVFISSVYGGGDFPEYEGYNVEFDLSEIRPEGAKVGSGRGKAPGPEPLQKALNKIKLIFADALAAGQTRFKSINCYDIIMHASDAVISGGIRRSATICLFSPDDEEMAKAKTGNWFIDNPQRGRSNNSAVLVRGETTFEEFQTLMGFVKQYGEPGFVWVDHRDLMVNPCVEIGFYPVCVETGESGWQACVSGDTKLITKDGIDNIKNLVGKDCKIWNGDSWKTVNPFVTGENRELYRVELSDGSYLDCTDNHEWLVKNRFEEEHRVVKTKDLLTGEKYKISTPRVNCVNPGGVWEEYAYEYGFVLGDGTARPNHSPFATLSGDDFKLNLRGKQSETKPPNEKYALEHAHITFTDLDNKFSCDLKYSQGLPRDVFTWDKHCILEFVSGWIDADGSKANDGCRLYGEESKIRDCQLLLTKVGVNSSVNLMSEAGSITNIGERRRSVWYLQIPNAVKLRSKSKGRRQIIQSVTKLQGLHTTYCVYEEEKNQCTFNNVLTKQCNLCEINGKHCNTPERFYSACKAGAIIGTAQAGYTDMGYLGDVSKRILEKEALLGISVTGMMDNPDVLFDPEVQKEGARVILEENKRIAKAIGINPTARATCVKPAGTTSCVLGTSSGIHPHHAKRYIRRTQSNYMEAPLAFFTKTNPLAVEKSVWSANGTDNVIAFCVEVPKGAKTKNDIGAIQLLDYVKSTQQHWVEAGKVEERCTRPWLSHNVSNTITVKDDEWEDVTEYIYANREYFAGISLLSISGDKDYQQAPFTAIYTPRELVTMYGDASVMASGMITDGLHAFEGNLWSACEAALGVRKVDYGKLEEAEKELKELRNGIEEGADVPPFIVFAAEEGYKKLWSQHDWVRRSKQFAERYFDGDVKKMTYCLKDVNNWKYWCDLQREYKDIDYSGMVEEEDNTKIEETTACSGGACQTQYA